MMSMLKLRKRLGLEKFRISMKNNMLKDGKWKWKFTDGKWVIDGKWKWVINRKAKVVSLELDGKRKWNLDTDENLMWLRL